MDAFATSPCHKTSAWLLMQAGGGWGSNGTLLLVMVLVVTWLLMRSWVKQRVSRRSAEAPIFAPKPERSGAPLVSAPADIARWQVEMHDLARDLSAQLDSKMGVLQQLIQQASREADRLEAALEKNNRGGDASRPTEEGTST